MTLFFLTFSRVQHHPVKGGNDLQQGEGLQQISSSADLQDMSIEKAVGISSPQKVQVVPVLMGNLQEKSFSSNHCGLSTVYTIQYGQGFINWKNYNV